MKPGSINDMPRETSATVRPIGPTVSNVRENSNTPCVGTRPAVVFNPTTPQHAAGTRTEPPVSVPYATSASPKAKATAEPLDEPPGRRDASKGFAGVPAQWFTPSAWRQSSTSWVFPTMRAPRRRAVATTGASAKAAGADKRAREPTTVGSPATSMQSFTASLGPDPDEGDSRTAQTASIPKILPQPSV